MTEDEETAIDLSKDQYGALKEIVKRLRDGEPLVTLGGYAGSGKSTLIPFIVYELFEDLKNTAFCCFTGKAANVIRSKLHEAGMSGDAGYIGTIHGLIYHPRKGVKGDVAWEKRTHLDLDHTRIKRVVIDEVSMVGKKLLDDLLSFGIQILAVGDPAQLPPINDESVIMKPHVLLSKIHRQAEDNPIIQFAAYIRKHGEMPGFNDSESIRRIGYKEASPILDRMIVENPMEVAVLARTNKARIVMNHSLFGDTPKEGHVVVCLRNNNREGIVNGMRGVIRAVRGFEGNGWCPMKIYFPDKGVVKGFPYVSTHQFGREKTFSPKELDQQFKTQDIGVLFDFGTCLTVHKAQGSAFSDVFLSPNPMGNRLERKQWLYTAVTRASERLYILPNW